MSAREFLRRQLTDDERSKLGALPTNDALAELLGTKQPLNSSLTNLSDKTIGAKGLDLLASSTSAAAINALGGSAGLIVSGMITSLDAVKLTGTVDVDRLPTIPNAKLSDLDASKLTGVIDVARLPVIPGNNSLSATSIAGLTTLQQAAVSLGTMVYTADGGAWRYSGSGSKTAEASYYYTADVTPEWNAIANKPALATAAQGALADTALQPGASAEALTEGATKKLLTTDERTKLAGITAGATANAPDASLRDRGTHTGEQAMTTVTGLVDALGNRLRVDASQTLTTGQKTQGQTNLGLSPYIQTLLDDVDQSAARNTLGVDQSALDARYLQSLGNRDIQIQKTNNPALVVRALDASSAFLRLRNTLGFYDIANDGGGQLAFNNYNADDTYQNTPLYFQNDGQPLFQIRPILVGAGAMETQNNKGVAGGYPSLDANGMVPATQLPVNGSYKGSWNANTNTPTITAGVGANGDEYTVSVAGTNSITGTSIAWSVGDRAKFTTNGNKWERIPSVQAVNSVNGQTGIVVLAKSDVGLGNVDNTSDLNKPVSNPQQAALNLKQLVLTDAAIIELGANLSGDRGSAIDFHSSGAPGAVDFDARIFRDPGLNGNWSFSSQGAGDIKFSCTGSMTFNNVPLATTAYVSTALSAKSDNFDTLDGGAI